MIISKQAAFFWETFWEWWHFWLPCGCHRSCGCLCSWNGSKKFSRSPNPRMQSYSLPRGSRLSTPRPPWKVSNQQLHDFLSPGGCQIKGSIFLQMCQACAVMWHSWHSPHHAGYTQALWRHVSLCVPGHTHVTNYSPQLISYSFCYFCKRTTWSGPTLNVFCNLVNILAKPLNPKKFNSVINMPLFNVRYSKIRILKIVTLSQKRNFTFLIEI